MDSHIPTSELGLRPVTVIVPSFNRAHLLARTIPSYLQDEVEELILVDDASSDDTESVVRELQAHDSRIVYLRNAVNLKQTASKNRAVACVRTRYIYFGDDDSLLAPKALAVLIQTLERTGAGVVGCRALYMHEQETIEACEARHAAPTEEVRDIVDLSRLHFDFARSMVGPIRVPVCPASCLIRSEIAMAFPFDTNYGGNAYREETDFLLRVSAAGHPIYYDSSVTQINLPPSVATGGARTGSRLRRELNGIVNTWKFARKNLKILESLAPGMSPLSFLLVHIQGRLRSAMRKLGTP
jgi:glycosyltransferase involved in cell wall biosynthesis